MKRKDLKPGDCFMYVGLVKWFVVPPINHGLPHNWHVSLNPADDGDVELLEHYSTHPEGMVKVTPGYKGLRALTEHAITAAKIYPELFDGLTVTDYEEEQRAADFRLKKSHLSPGQRQAAQSRLPVRCRDLGPEHAITAAKIYPELFDGLTVTDCLHLYEEEQRAADFRLKKSHLSPGQRQVAQREWALVLAQKRAEQQKRERDAEPKIDREFEDWE